MDFLARLIMTATGCNQKSQWKNMTKSSISLEVATQLNLDLVKCLEIAYEEIKDRNGKMVNGTYVKSEDL